MLHEFSPNLGDPTPFGCAIVITGDLDCDRLDRCFPRVGIARAPIILAIPGGDRTD